MDGYPLRLEPRIPASYQAIFLQSPILSPESEADLVACGEAVTARPHAPPTKAVW
jgi:hypothetical protein